MELKGQSERLGTEPVGRLLANLSIPAVVGMLVMALYNVVDTIFIARAVGTIGVAATSIVFPVQMIMMAVAGAIGIGGASVISRRLGAGQVDEANRVFGNVNTLVLIVSLLSFLVGILFLEEILTLFGASEAILPYARDFLGILLFGTFFFTFGFAMNNVVRSEGNAKVAMMTMILGAGLNIIFNPIFIFGLGWGIKGSALATVLAQGLTTLYLLYYFASGKSTLTFKWSNLRLKWAYIKEILAIGSSSFIHQTTSSLMFVLVNYLLIAHGGELAVAVFGIINRIIMFSIMPMIGVMQGVMPIVGYNYGARKYDRISSTVRLAYKVTFIIGSIVFVITMAFPRPLFSIFTRDPQVLEMGETALRLIFLLCATIGFQMVTGGVFQALGKARAALILSMSRQILFLIPLLLILPLFWDLIGVWLSFTISDALGFLLSFFYMWSHRDLLLYAMEGKNRTRESHQFLK